MFADRPSLEEVGHLRAITVDLVREYGRTSTLYIAMNNTPLPDAPARVALGEITSEVANHLVAVASVICGDGFWASAIRGFATSVHWMSDHAYKRRVFSDVGVAARWLAPLHSVASLAVDPEDLDRAIAGLLPLPGLCGRG